MAPNKDEYWDEEWCEICDGVWAQSGPVLHIRYPNGIESRIHQTCLGEHWVTGEVDGEIDPLLYEMEVVGA